MAREREPEEGERYGPVHQSVEWKVWGPGSGAESVVERLLI